MDRASHLRFPKGDHPVTKRSQLSGTGCLIVFQSFTTDGACFCFRVKMKDHRITRTSTTLVANLSDHVEQTMTV